MINLNADQVVAATAERTSAFVLPNIRYSVSVRRPLPRDKSVRTGTGRQGHWGWCVRLEALDRDSGATADKGSYDVKIPVDDFMVFFKEVSI